MHKVLGQIGSKLWFPWHRKPPLTYNGETMSPSFLVCIFNRSFLYLQVTRTCIKSRTSSNFGQIGPLTTELAALERSHRLIIGKCCLMLARSVLNISQASLPVLIKFYGSIIRVEERLHKVLGQIGSNLWFPWQQKALIDLL